MTNRRMLPPILCALLGPVLASAQGVSGVWNVVAQPGSVNTCTGKAEAAAYRWVVSEKDGEISIVVQGETAYPKLTGKLSAATVVLEGEGQARLGAIAYPNSVFVLDLKGRAIRGTRYVIHFKPARQGGMTTCLVTYTVRGEMM